MLCASCHRLLSGARVCATCGAPVPGAIAPLELVLDGAAPVPMAGEITIGRGGANSLRLNDPSVSRTHARISPYGDGSGAVLEDLGSSHGTAIDGAPALAPVVLRCGSQIRVGDQQILVRARRAAHDASRTIVVPAGADPLGLGPETPGTRREPRPRLRPGYAIKCLEASEAPRRWVMRDLGGGEAYLRVSERDARLLALLDGTRSIADLVADAREVHGDDDAGPELARLLVELREHGMLDGLDDDPAAGPGGPARRREPAAAVAGWRRLFRTRELASPRAGPIFGSLYRRGGWLLFSRPAAATIAAIGLGGVACFVAVVAGRHGRPFVVAGLPLLGGLAFVGGRALLVVAHELAHGLALEAVGRRAPRAGLKLVVVFPYAFVDTSPVWFEPRRRRRLVSAAGPIADATVAGAFAIACLALQGGTIGDILFQVALAGYVAAFLNLNPWLERDGYHLLADRLDTPDLRRRARERLRARLRGTRGLARDRALERYAVAGVAWSCAVAAIAITGSLHYRPQLAALVSPAVAWALLGALWCALLAPLAIVVGPALAGRARGAGAAPAGTG